MSITTETRQQACSRRTEHQCFKGVEFGIGFEAARKTAVKSMTKSSGTKKRLYAGNKPSRRS
ncbi:hypothetical protein PO124_16090 [Bacillus licheniformis]|nr:hypothetical protein [Bacillus licheniformis]